MIHNFLPRWMFESSSVKAKTYSFHSIDFFLPRIQFSSDGCSLFIGIIKLWKIFLIRILFRLQNFENIPALRCIEVDVQTFSPQEFVGKGRIIALYSSLRYPTCWSPAFVLVFDHLPLQFMKAISRLKWLVFCYNTNLSLVHHIWPSMKLLRCLC